jgi:hypothetical protein
MRIGRLTEFKAPFGKLFAIRRGHTPPSVILSALDSLRIGYPEFPLPVGPVLAMLKPFSDGDRNETP